MNTDLLQGFYLGDRYINPQHGAVTSQESSRHLPPKAMEVLLWLATQPGELVTREYLMRAAWGEGQATSEALNHAISEIRYALDDHAERPEFVQTLRGRGYRLLVVPSTGASREQRAIAATGKPHPGADVGLIEDLKRRGVFEAAVAYLVLGWLLIQVADIVIERLLLPDIAATFVTSLVIAGFPIALALSWYLEFRDGRAVIDDLSPTDISRRRFGRRYIAVVGGLAIAALLVTAYDRNVGLPQADGITSSVVDEALPPIQENSIAVLPFFNVDGSDESEIFGNGLVDDLLTALSRVPGLAVSSRGDSFTLEPNTASSRVRDRLRVARYVEGSIEINDGAMRIIVQLIDSATGFHILSLPMDREPSAYFQMRDEITRSIVAHLRVALPPETRTAMVPLVSDPSVDVYLLYRRGIDASRKPDMASSFDTVLEWFDAALELDPQYAAAHAGKCSAYAEAYTYRTLNVEYIDAAEQACATAISLNPNLDVVYVALGKLYLATGRHDSSEQSYRDALLIDPGNTEALIGLGEVYRLQQRSEEAEASIRRAAGLHPGDWSAYNALGTYLYRSGRYGEAAEQFRIVVALDDSIGRAHENLASALMLAGEFDAAEPEYRRAIELDPSATAYTNLGLLLYYLARYDEAIDSHRLAVAHNPRDYLTHSNLGDALRAAGYFGESVEVFAQARELARRVLAVNPNDAFIQMDLAWISAVLGATEEAHSLIERARESVPDDPYVHYIDALILNLTGEMDRALAALALAVENGYSTKMLAADPNFLNLRGNTRFDAVMALQ